MGKGHARPGPRRQGLKKHASTLRPAVRVTCRRCTALHSREPWSAEGARDGMDATRVWDLSRSAHAGHIDTMRRSCEATCGAIVQGAGDGVRCQRVPQGTPFPQGGMTWCGGPEQAGGDDGGALPRQAGDARDAGGLPRFRQVYRQQDSGEAPRQPRPPRPRRAEDQKMMDTLPASCSAPHGLLGGEGQRR